MSKHLGLQRRCVSHSSSWCTNAGVLRLTGIEVRRMLPQVCCCCCWCSGGDEVGEWCECPQWPVDDWLDRRRVVLTVAGFGGGDSRLLLNTDDCVCGSDDDCSWSFNWSCGGDVVEVHEDADSLSFIIDSVSSIETDGNFFVVNEVFFLKTNFNIPEMKKKVWLPKFFTIHHKRCINCFQFVRFGKPLI